MGGQFSKKTEDGAPAPLHLSTDTLSTADLSSYEAACKVDPELQSFDTTLQERTNRVINTLAIGVEVRSVSLDSLREVTGCLLEMNQEVVKVILDSKKDIWENQQLFDLVEEYFETSLKTLDFCTALEKCLKRARDSQLIVQVALKHFEEEDGSDGATYSRTLHELNNFRSVENPFSEEFYSLFESVYKQQVSMLEKLQMRKRKLDKKLKTVKAWRKVSNIIFVATFVSVLICSVVAAAVVAPPVVTAVLAAAAVPLGSMGKWSNSLWRRCENALKGQREIYSSMQVGTYITIKDLENIRVLVSRLEIKIEALLKNADLALREEEAVKFVIDEIKRKLFIFMETTEDLCRHADKCSRDIGRARTVILQRIIKHPENEESFFDMVQ